MTAAQQLKRIAAVRPPQVRIYLMDRGYSVWSWLCPKHLAWKRSQGWETKQDNDPPHELKCDFRAGPGSCSQ